MAQTTPDEDTLSGRGFPEALDAVTLVSEIVSRYGIPALEPLLHVCRSAAACKDLSIALLGRFKAGKSSFLNHFFGRDLLPVGVIPVTSVITELRWGPHEGAEVLFLDGRRDVIPIDAVSGFIAESSNRQNVKHVSNVVLRVPQLAAYKGLRFIDTPGLESAFSYNTEASLAWIPHVDLALVAVGVDPPLSQQDIALIQKLFEYTPKVCVLLTKVDVLTKHEWHEVLHFVQTQLNRRFDTGIEVFPYSIRPGFEELKPPFEEQFVRAVSTVREQKQQIVNHKIRTLLRECEDFIQLKLRSAEMIDAERQELRKRAFGDERTLSDTRLELQLVARHQVGSARNHIGNILAPFEKNIQVELAGALEQQFPAWKISFARLLQRFEDWLRHALTLRLAELSASHKYDFLKPICDLQRQYHRVLQSFRDRLSARAIELFGSPLRTTEIEIEPASPQAPDINIGRIFDHNWELISPILPTFLLRGLIRKHLVERTEYETHKNLSRLTTQ